VSKKEKGYEINFEITVEGRVVIHDTDEDAAIAALKKMRLSKLLDTLSTPDFYIDQVYEVEEGEEDAESEEEEGEAIDE